MKKLLIMVIGILTIGATLPVIAGDDRQSDRLRNMELRKTKLAHRDKEAVPQAQVSKLEASASLQQTDKGIQMDKMMKECTEMMKKPT